LLLISGHGGTAAKTAVGHEDQFLPLRVSARSVIRKQTVAATRGMAETRRFLPFAHAQGQK
jgi:hypothetical protein